MHLKSARADFFLLDLLVLRCCFLAYSDFRLEKVQNAMLSFFELCLEKLKHSIQKLSNLTISYQFINDVSGKKSVPQNKPNNKILLRQVD
jgi:hypothetical protein